MVVRASASKVVLPGIPGISTLLNHLSASLVEQR